MKWGGCSQAEALRGLIGWVAEGCLKQKSTILHQWCIRKCFSKYVTWCCALCVYRVCWLNANSLSEACFFSIFHLVASTIHLQAGCLCLGTWKSLFPCPILAWGCLFFFCSFCFFQIKLSNVNSGQAPCEHRYTRTSKWPCYSWSVSCLFKKTTRVTFILSFMVDVERERLETKISKTPKVTAGAGFFLFGGLQINCVLVAT